MRRPIPSSTDFGKPLSDIPGLNPDDLPVGTFVGPVSGPGNPLVKWVDNMWHSPFGAVVQTPPLTYRVLSVPTTSVGYPVNRLRDNIKMVRGMLGVPESTSTPDDSIQDAKELESILAHLLSLTRSRLIQVEKVRDTAVRQSIAQDLEPLRKCVARLHDMAGIRGEVLMNSRDRLEYLMDASIKMLEVQARARDSRPSKPEPEVDPDVEKLKGFVNRVRRALGGSETEYNTKEELMRALDAGLRGVETRGVQSKTKDSSLPPPAPAAPDTTEEERLKVFVNHTRHILGRPPTRFSCVSQLDLALTSSLNEIERRGVRGPEAPPAPPTPAPTLALADVPMDTLLQEVAKRLKESAPFVDRKLVRQALGLW